MKEAAEAKNVVSVASLKFKLNCCIYYKMKVITPYMMALHKELKDSRDIADSTASQYIRTLYTLNSDRAFNNLAWLKNIDSVDLRLGEYAESTQKTMLSTIVSA